MAPRQFGATLANGCNPKMPAEERDDLSLLLARHLCPSALGEIAKCKKDHLHFNGYLNRSVEALWPGEGGTTPV